ncbi:uncharacterized protein [Mobula birostris]|uniref:uncharacterized protein n=1 Tax=Mobula birostris TaxID=1983395 RepID=UPI003B287D74
MSEVIQLATLGRPFQLGMLYDCRSDVLIPGITLWDLQTLQSNVGTRDQPSTEFHIIASDAMDEKASALNVSGSMKVSLMCGLVEVKGSAKYLNDTKGSKQQARVTLQYKTTTRFEQLTMSHLGRQNITYPSVFDEGSATHVITAVLYGAQAFFVFDQMVSTAEKLQDIQGNMESAIKRLPKIAIEGEASLKMTEEQKSNAEKFSCTFYGDFSLKNNPTTFQDAISIYATLPSLLGPDGEHAVPMTVWLYPLNKLDSTAVQLVREISVGLLTRCQHVLEQLSEAVMRCNDMQKERVASKFPEVRDRIVKFRELCQECKLVFQKTLAKDLPIIRGGAGEEELLVDILKKKKESPLRHQLLITWLDDKERELKVLGHYLRIFDDISSVKIVHDLEDELMDCAMDYVVCFAFTTLHQEDTYLSEAINYLQSNAIPKMQTPIPADGDYRTHRGEQWFHSEVVKRKMKEQSQLFLDFATANKSHGNIKFLVASVKDDSHIGTSIYLYEGPCIKNRCFEPPSQPPRAVASGTTHDSVTLQIHPPRYGTSEIVGYKIEYKATQQEEWTIVDTHDKSESFTISGLQPHQEYYFQYRAVTKIGVSKASDSYRQITLPTSSPGKLVFEDCSSFAKLSWDSPSCIGAGVKIVQYRIEYREETALALNTEAPLWMEVKMTESECRYNLMGLQPRTDYRVRVSADCGEAGSSVPSEEILIKIGETTKEIPQTLHTEGQLLSTGNPSIYMLNLQKEVFNESKHLVNCFFGKPSIGERMKTIMVMGATGSGKTTLINGMINYILGVEWGDNFRYRLIQEETGKSQAESQTSSITAYNLHHQVGFKIDYSLTIIDTPGFGDTRGISRDKLITDNIREFFTSPQGVDQIDAVCFVAQASLARLTQTQKYVFDSILSIFGKDIAENIQILVTFADGKRPPVLEALKVAEVPCPKDKNGMPIHFKFNNSVIFAQRPVSGNAAKKRSSDDSGEEEEDDDNFDAMFWKMGTNSMKKFFRALDTMEPKSLVLTKEVLRERNQLEATMKGLQNQIQVGLTKLEELKKTQQVLEQHQNKLDENKDFEFEVEVTYTIRKDLERNASTVNVCKKCEFNCHDPCTYAAYILKYWCVSMDKWGNCKVCPNKCGMGHHSRERYKYVYEKVKKKKTLGDIKKKYEKACGEKITQEKIMEELKQEFEGVQNAVLELIVQLSQSIRRLEEVALRPNPLSTPAYIDLLIQSEKDEGKPGYMERIQSLTMVKEQAVLMEQVISNGKQSSEDMGQDLLTGKKDVRQLIKSKCSKFSDWLLGDK